MDRSAGDPQVVPSVAAIPLRDASSPGLERVVDTFRGAADAIDLAFWNVEWLTSTYASKAAGVARIIAELDLDVLVIEESSPGAAQALVDELGRAHGLSFGWMAAEPSGDDGKQSCTVLWNTKTTAVSRESWGAPVDTWLAADSRHFDQLGFEAVHGRIFDRYPALFEVAALAGPAGRRPLRFHLVPLHLKARDEGSLRRRMASRILAAAIQKKIELGATEDWVLGGDYNAELASDDFQHLIGGGFVPLSAEDAGAGAFTYVKAPHRSLIDHVFVSAGMTGRVGSGDFFSVAVDRTIPEYAASISDHRPVIVRLRLRPDAARPDDSGFESATEGDPARRAALDELRRRLELLASPVPGDAAGPCLEEGGFEAARGRAPRTAADYAGRDGYAASFLGKGELLVPLPKLSSGLADRAAEPAGARGRGTGRLALRYTHFSVVLDGSRRLPIVSAVNIDGRSLRRFPRSGDRWLYDPRVDRARQAGDEIYRNNDLDRGHMTRRLDPVWGTAAVAALADEDTFHFTNACPQHKDLNQKEWSGLEDYVLESAKAHELKVCVMTGPVFGDEDKPYREIHLPEEFWKVVVIVRCDTGTLSATGYVLSQRDFLTGFEFVYGRYRTYQVTLRSIEQRTGLDFGALARHDPLAGAAPESFGGFEAVAGAGPAKLVTGRSDIVL